MPATHRPSWPRRLLIITAVLGLVAVTACGNASDSSKSPSTSATSGSGGASTASAPGVTSDEIRFSVIGTNSGNPLGTCILDCYAKGIQAYFDYRNSEGGIDGRKLVISKTLDDELAKNKERALEVVSANDTFANFNAALLATGWADLNSAGIPTYVWAINPAQMTGQQAIFGNREVVCGTCTSRGVAYAAKLAGATRTGAIGYGVTDNSKQCAQSADASIKQYGGEVGAEAAYLNDDIAFGLPNGIAPEVTAMKQAGVDLVYGCIDLNGMKTLAQELKRQGMDNVKLYLTNGYDQKYVGESGDLFEGDIVVGEFRPFEADTGSSSVDKYKEWMAKNGDELSELAMIGWINADEAYQGIKAAGPDFDRQKVIDAMNQMTAYTGGGLTQPIDWSRQHEAPTQDDPASHGPAQDCITVVQVKDGKFVVPGDPSKPYICWPGTTRDWSEPTVTDFS